MRTKGIPTGLAEVQEKKAVVVAVVLDTSGSMGESGSMEAAKQNMADFIRQLGDNDYLLPISFSSNFTVLHPLGRYVLELGLTPTSPCFLLVVMCT